MSLSPDDLFFQRKVPTSVPELVESFSKLLLDASDDNTTLNTFQEMITTAIERASKADSGSESGNTHDDIINNSNTIGNNDIQTLENLNDLVSHKQSIFTCDELAELNVMNELLDLYMGKHFVGKYVWMASHQVSYQFGRKNYQPQNISHWKGITSLMQRINSKYHLGLDCCLIIRYKNDDKLSLHQDDESILDDAHPIVVVPFGCPRKIEFWDSGSESTGTIAFQATPSEGDLLMMHPGCQEKLWHRVVKNEHTDKKGVRYALSFRKLSERIQSQEFPIPHQLTASTPVSKPPNVKRIEYPIMHPSRVASMSVRPLFNTSDLAEQPTVPFVPLESGQSGHIAADMGVPDNAQANVMTLPALPDPPLSQSQVPPPGSDRRAITKTAKHLVIGDSMVNGLYMPGSIKIYKGGIKPGQLLQLLPAFTDILHPKNYDDIRSVTVVVGTNAINVPSHGKGMPLLDVMHNYEKLISDIQSLFPKARIGLYNILPRAHTCPETVERIQLFNNIFSNHVATRLGKVFWIRQYWEFLDSRGSLRDDLYGRLGLHLKLKGKNLMSKCIRNFQKSYN